MDRSPSSSLHQATSLPRERSSSIKASRPTDHQTQHLQTSTSKTQQTTTRKPKVLIRKPSKKHTFLSSKIRTP